MSVDATIATWKLGKEISAIQKLILLALADRAGESGECWPSLKRIIKDTNLDRHTIIDNRQALINKGLLKYTGGFKGKTNSVPVMKLTYINNREGEIDIEHVESFSSAKNNTASSGVEINTSSGVEINTTKQCGNTHLEPKRIEPKKEPNIIDIERGGFQPVDNFLVLQDPKAYSKLKKESDESFDLFYSAYPRKKGENRARVAWMAQSCYKIFAVIMEALEEQNSNDDEFRTGFAPSAEKYIIEERWKDKPIRKTKTSKNSSSRYNPDHTDDSWAININKDYI